MSTEKVEAKSTEKKVSEFKEYVRKLLNAQTYDFLKEYELFTPETLKKILAEFCDIIAKYLNADSCTIHLKIYDSKLLNKYLLEAHIKEKIGKLKNNYINKHKFTEEDGKVFEENRVKLLKSFQTFPYWKYPKGLAKLIAANKDSPWERVANRDEILNRNPQKNNAENKINWDTILEYNMELGYIPLDSGITKLIYQENIAAIKDRLSMRSTRNFRKLGGADQIVWNNEKFTYKEDNKTKYRYNIFKNYYGVPIRIHTGGEVIGILKVENKKDDDSLDLQSIKNANDLETRILEKIKKEYDKTTDVGKLNISLLSLVYLVTDISRPEYEKIKIEELIFIPFPAYSKHCTTNNKKNNGYQFLIPTDKNPRPPIQIITKTLDDEKLLWKRIFENEKVIETTIEKAPHKVNIYYKNIKSFYEKLTNVIINYLNSTCYCEIYKNDLKKQIFLKNIVNNIEGFSELIQIHVKEEKLSDFYFKIEIVDKSGKERNIPLYLFIPPTRNEFNQFWEDQNKNTVYKEINKFWEENNAEYIYDNYDKRKKFNKDYSISYNGELVEYTIPKTSEKGQVVDLLIDRLAARTQAYILSLPVTEFSDEDTHKLSWAAYEIGKLIEREISYRANHSKDPIPLTAMEFYRIPISDLSFVDDLQNRRKKAKEIKENLDRYLENLIYHMDMKDFVRYNSRVKENRSLLLRLGERHEGFVRGNIAIWIYLLSIKINNMTKKIHNDDYKKFIRNLEIFKIKVEKIVNAENEEAELLIRDMDLTKENIKNALDFFKSKNNYIIGDLKFNTPPFIYDKENINKINENHPLQRIIFNLEDELFLKEIEVSNKKGIDLNSEINLNQLEHLLLREYDEFAQNSFSLISQIQNQINNNETFNNFYKMCYMLRNLFCTSLREIEDETKYRPLKEIFGIIKEEEKENKNHNTENHWTEIMDFIDKNRTEEDFLKIFQLENPKSVLFLTPEGIYKRIRTLHNILHHQRSCASLDWELGRFDLLGCRANCLYKNQVYALYEYIWNIGDPFFFYNVDAKEKKDFLMKDDLEKNKVEKIKTSHLYWLCMRTNIFKGEYNSLQISALTDPESLNPGGFWSRSGYNIKRLRLVLGKLFEKTEAADKYKNYASNRDYIRRKCIDWHKKVAVKISKHEPFIYNDIEDGTLWFGSFLFEGVFDILINLLDDFKNKKNHINDESFNKFLEIIVELREVIKYSYDYTKQLIMDFANGNNNNFQNDKFVSSITVIRIKNIYSKTKELLASLEKNKMKSYKETEKLTNILEKEEKYFSNFLKTSNIPLFFLDCQFRGECNKDIHEGINADKKNCYMKAFDPNLKKDDFIKQDFLIRTLMSIRRDQRSYMFDKGCGLSIRDKYQTLTKIKNNIILFRPDDGKELQKQKGEDFTIWTAYDLFYYVRSLIPVEIQIRTELANTIAEQYHDPIYKGHPPFITEFPKKMMEDTGKKLDGIDREMEIDYEDYVVRYYLSKIK
ncbi:MAG: hypothetical protein HY934_09140 [Candidatus Firestonebacteria bacterium]|nr:hypothetical protein [Candidatus Firestonebacteria bacterium]